jgi:beta-lactamase superfamily II metal-dependent hydrolase
MKFIILSLYCICCSALAGIEIIHINIGQGDSTLIIGPKENGQNVSILIDAGNIKNPDAGQVLSTLLHEKNISKLDAVIVTHYDADHLGGLITKPADRAKNYWGTRVQDGLDGVKGTDDDVSIMKVIDRGFSDIKSDETTTLKQYKVFANNHNNHVSLVTKADINNFQLDLGANATLTALSANGYVKNHNKRVDDVTTENERSLSFLLNYGDFNYFIGGDVTGRSSGGEDAKIEIAIGQYLHKAKIELDVIQVNHHGANNGSSVDFLKLTKPKIAIISAGNQNSHKHPTYGALKRLSESSVESIFVTEFGSTVWNDSLLSESSKNLSLSEKSKVEEIHSIRKKLVIAQSNITVISNGATFSIFTQPLSMSAK